MVKSTGPRSAGDLGSTGYDPPADHPICGNLTIQDEAVTCDQSCSNQLIEFRITNGTALAGGDGDGDGDGDGEHPSRGWDGNSGWYACGYEGSDPSGQEPFSCPPGLEEGAPCGPVTGVGCCDPSGDNWYCTEDLTLHKATCERELRARMARHVKMVPE